MSWFDTLFSGGTPQPVQVTPAVTPGTANSVNGGRPILGGMLRYDPGAASIGMGQPLSPSQRFGLFGAALSDVADSVRGMRANNVAAWQGRQFGVGQAQAQALARQAYAKALASGDAKAILSARAGLIASGAVSANYAFPQIQRGYVMSADGSQASAVAGGPADPRVIAQRAAARRGQVMPQPTKTTTPDGQVVYVYGDPDAQP